MTMFTGLSIDAALRDPNLLGAGLGPAETWGVWISILKAARGLPLTDDERAVFASVAGDREPPKGRVRECWAIVGRRSGKSRMAAAVAVYEAVTADTSRLVAGEIGHVLVMAASKTQALAVYNYCKGFIEASPILAEMVESVTADEIRLTNRTAIVIHTANHRTIRGRTVIAAIFDESAFWRSEESSSPDVEVYRAVLPALSAANGMLVGISSPYGQRGLLYNKHNQSFGINDGSVLVVRAGTRLFNPKIDQAIIDQAHIDDPEAAAAEWDGHFRGDLSTFIDRGIVERLVDVGVHERPYDRKWKYVGFVDPSGGAHDSMTLGISHKEGDTAVLDCIREVKPPFAPADVVSEFRRVLDVYRISTVNGDRYAGTWVSDAFRKEGIRYIASERSRSEIYLDALPLLMSGSASLLDNTRLVGQIAQLERRTTRTGRDQVDHMTGASDDVANAALGALVNVPSARRAESASQAFRAPVVNLGHANMKAKTGRYGPITTDRGPYRQ
ncbi:terminase [Mesorhizobium sp. M4B.F.Ca.ET.017.02.2.1]|uniref:terminase n=1 Tax=Mesorhizobium sp. M4B.F.Ca.ET.017.02.2.1 TaxID=2496649 RepID=UPI000FCA5C59|nr:terminase [Mesorhizobium sp. M4B.F.Ca.ET.017.02.2.1]RVD21019.1 terminase [Mesorhizobium sp. M4B.F.Ca.ET.017.02.2.1]